MCFFGKYKKWGKSAAKSKRIMLDEGDFAELVRGDVVTQDGVQIALKDIGYTRMCVQIEKAMKGT